MSDNSKLSKSLKPIPSGSRFSSPRRSWGGLRRRRRHEKAKTKVARMTEAKRATDRSGERNAEPASRPTATVVAAFAPEAFELDWPESVRADHLLVFDGHDLRQARPTLQLLSEYVPGESLGRCIIFGPIALATA
jgi:hypothetical protein